MGYLGTKPANSPLTSELIPDGLIATSDIADNAITTSKIAAGAVVPAGLSQPMTLGTAVASTSGTSIDFTGIPSWVKRITVMFSNLSTNGASVPIVQLGDSGGVETSGYLGSASYAGPSTVGTTFTTGFGLAAGAAPSSVLQVNMTINRLNLASNLWVASFSGSFSDANYSVHGGGSKSLSSTLDRIRITTVNGTDTFDAGSINILYE
jgi:hypothetical protein